MVLHDERMSIPGDSAMGYRPPLDKACRGHPEGDYPYFIDRDTFGRAVSCRRQVVWNGVGWRAARCTSDGGDARACRAERIRRLVDLLAVRGEPVEPPRHLSSVAALGTLVHGSTSHHEQVWMVTLPIPMGGTRSVQRPYAVPAGRQPSSPPAQSAHWLAHRAITWRARQGHSCNLHATDRLALRTISTVLLTAIEAIPKRST